MLHPVTGGHPETPVETEGGELPYKAARSGDILMVIDGENFLRARGGCAKGLLRGR